MKTLQEICKPIDHHLQEFEEKFVSKLKSDVNLLNDVVNYVLQNRGKRFRPI